VLATVVSLSVWHPLGAMARMPKDFASIACIHCGYALEGVSSSRCPECGAPFDPSDPTTFRRLLPDPVKFWVTSIEQAQRVRAELAEHSIDVVIEEAIGVFQPGYATLWVSRHSQFAVCWSCGSDRSGSPVMARPKKRRSVPASVSRTPLTRRERLLAYLIFILLVVAAMEFWAFPGHVPIALIGVALALVVAILSSILRHLPSRETPNNSRPPSGASHGT
jgi:hypothetical protein